MQKAAPAPSRKRIVSVEDDPVANEFVRMALRNDNYDLVTVEDPGEGLEIIEQNPPDLVLLDIMMPNIDGWEVFRQMRTHPWLKNVPVIVVTSRATEADRLYGEKVARVDAFLAKPFSARELRGIVREVLSR